VQKSWCGRRQILRAPRLNALHNARRRRRCFCERRPKQQPRACLENSTKSLSAHFPSSLLSSVQGFQYVFSPDVKIFLAARTGFLGESFCEENDSGSPTFAPFRTERPALDATYDKCARESELLCPANTFDILLRTECSRSKAGMV
jgi:hypothetical protein